ncbi:unnamed protein product [Lactuca virosa]|uniref:DUF7642 domain-containing protein n=1 Tax=Lactuca virosa TaxID=75947 RepID=A0AAU9PD45_9ASTR|nr:unnamed protein product [Lactuca virosa]
MIFIIDGRNVSSQTIDTPEIFSDSWLEGCSWVIQMGCQEWGLQKELSLADPVSELDGDVSWEILYSASFEEFASSIFTRCQDHRLYLFGGVVNSERRIPLARAIDIIIEQGCLQAMFGIHTFRLESVAQGKVAYVDELQIQGVSNPQLLRKVIVKEASKVIQIQDVGTGRSWRHGSEPQTPAQMRSRSFTDGSNFLRSASRNWKNSPRPPLQEQRGLNHTDVIINKMVQLSKSIKKLEGIVEKTQATHDYESR